MTFPRHPRFAGRVVVAGLLSALTLGSVTHAAPARVQAARAASNNSTLTIGWAIETKTLDPVNNTQNPDIWVMVNIYDQLLRVGPDGKTIEPDLATSYTSSNGGTVFTFHLRKGVKFQDGTPLKASDVAFALNRAVDKKQNATWAFTLTAVKKVEAPNDSTVRVTLKHPWGPFLSDIALFDTGVYPEAYFKKVGEKGLSAHPIGTGPYALDTWKRGQYLRLKKNMSYFNASAYPMAKVEYDLIPSDNTRLLEVEAGELDVDNVLPYNQITQVSRSNSAAVVIDPSTQTNYLTFNTKVAPFNNVNVRQAINHSINRAALVKAVLYGHGSPANSFIPAGALFHDYSIPVPSYDPTLAKSLLAKSGHPHGFSMTQEVAAGSSVDLETAVILKQEVAPLGIKINIKQIDPTTLFNDQQVGKYDFTGNLWTNDIPDPDELTSFAIDYTQGANAFYTNYDNPQLISLSHQAEQTNDSATRRRLYYQIQQLWAQNVPFVALYYAPFVNAVNSKVQGFHENPLGYFNLQGVHKS